MRLRSNTEYSGEPNRVLRVAQRYGLTNNRNLFWAWGWDGRSYPRNFGDWIGPLLFEAFTGRVPIYCGTERLKARASTVFSVGSIIRYIKESDRAIVWGSGIISRSDRFERPKEIFAVRGPMTRSRCVELGFSCPEVFGDPAILLPRIIKPKNTKTHAIGLIPHMSHLNAVRLAIDHIPEFKLIDVSSPVQTVIEDIVSCERTISSSLHGVIVSHAYGVPSAWVQFSTLLDGDDVKFADYFGSVSLESPVPARIHENELDISLIRRIAREAILPDLSPLEDRLIESCPFKGT